jgi:uncharacterized delta-60 repeat protein
MWYNTLLKLFFIFLLNVSIIGGLQAQTLDPDFQPMFRNSSSTVNAMVTQPDGKVIVAGSFSFAGGAPVTRIARLNADGTIDNTFNSGTSANDIIRAAALQDDGKIVIGGDFTEYNGTPVRKLARLNADGSLDNTFNVGGGPDNVVYAIALQKVGEGNYKVIAGGTFNKVNGASASKIVRLNSDGNIDNSFGIDTGFDNMVRTIYLQKDGRILVGGDFKAYRGAAYNHIIRLEDNGSVDNTFNTGAGADNKVYAIKVQEADSKILVGGEFVSFNDVPANRAVRLNANGSVDDSFDVMGGFSGGYSSVRVESFAIQSDGKIIAGGAFTLFNNKGARSIVRLDQFGTMDTTFKATPAATGTVSNIVNTSEGKLVVAGSFSSYENKSTCIVGLNANGSLDNGFAPTLEGIGIVNRITMQKDGKILVGGLFTSVSDAPAIRLARLNADGTKDETFNIGTGANQGVNAIAVQEEDGKIIVGGDFSFFNGEHQVRLIRLNPDGTKDTTFNVGTGFNQSVTDVIIQPDGRILVGGYFSTFNDVPMNRIARLNTDGSLDDSFVIGTGFQGNQSRIQTIYLQPDEKILIGGGFNSYNDISANNIIRLNADGTIDESFDPGSGANATVNTIAMQDGKIIAGGYFTTFNGFSRNRITRLNSDGSLDNSINLGGGANNIIKSIVVQKDNKMLVGGDFTAYNGVANANYVIRLNEDGTMDNAFNLTPGFSGPVSTVAHLSDNSALVGGTFTEVAGQPRIGLAKVNNVLAASNSPRLTTPVNVYPNPASGAFTLDLADIRTRNVMATLYNMTGQQVMAQQLDTTQGTAQHRFDVSTLRKGVYILHIISDKGTAQKKIVVE